MSKITKIELQKRNQERVNIFVDESFLMGCSAELVYTHGLKQGMDVDESKLKKIIEEDEEINIRNKIFKFVERSLKTEKQIKDKLIEIECSEENIEKMIEILKEYGYVDDKMYIENFFKSKIESWSIRKIEFTLIQRGVNKEMIKEYLSNQEHGNDEYETAINIGKRKYESIIKSTEDKNKRKEKLYRFLASKAYGYDVISKVISEVMNSEN